MASRLAVAVSVPVASPASSSPSPAATVAPPRLALRPPTWRALRTALPRSRGAAVVCQAQGGQDTSIQGDEDEEEERYFTAVSRGGSSTSAWKEATEGLRDDDKDGDDCSRGRIRPLLPLAFLCLAVLLPSTLLPPSASASSSSPAAGGGSRKRRWVGFDYYVLDGLWPQYNYGGWPSCCRPTKFNINKILMLMPMLEKYWPSLYCGSSST